MRVASERKVVLTPEQLLQHFGLEDSPESRSHVEAELDRHEIRTLVEPRGRDKGNVVLTKGRSPAIARAGRTPNDSFVSLGYWLSILFPVVGFLIGLVLMSRGERRATNVIVLSIVLGIVWFIVGSALVAEDFST